jgi:hypothetical protein
MKVALPRNRSIYRSQRKGNAICDTPVSLLFSSSNAPAFPQVPFSFLLSPKYLLFFSFFVIWFGVQSEALRRFVGVQSEALRRFVGVQSEALRRFAGVQSEALRRFAGVQSEALRSQTKRSEELQPILFNYE